MRSFAAESWAIYHGGTLFLGSMMVVATPQKILKKQVREWCSVAYERELGAELKKLHDSFHAWEHGKLNCFDLSDLIHHFHDDTARELYKTYVMFADDWSNLKRAVGLGLVSEQELSAELLELVRKDTKPY